MFGIHEYSCYYPKYVPMHNAPNFFEGHYFLKISLQFLKAGIELSMLMCKEIPFIKKYICFFVCVFMLLFVSAAYAEQAEEQTAASMQNENTGAVSDNIAAETFANQEIAAQNQNIPPKNPNNAEQNTADGQAGIQEENPYDQEWDLAARSNLRTFLATMGGTIQEEYLFLKDTFKEQYADIVQLLRNECVFILIPKAPRKEFEIEVIGDKLLNLKSTIAAGDSLGSLLNGWISFPTILQLVDKSKDIYSLHSLKLNQPFSLLIDLNDKSLKKFEYEFDNTHKIILNHTGDSYEVMEEEIVYDYQLCFLQGTVSSNFYNAVINTGENGNFAIRLADIFSYDIDFAREIREGDTFSALVEKRYRDGNFNGYGRIIAARFVNNDVLYEAFLFHDSEQEGKLSYFDRTGKALQKAFLRTPVHFTRISSNFSMARKHPILGITRAHPAIDYAAPKGTPVMAVGDGTVMRAAYTGGYGHLILLKHKGNLESQYAHLSGYAKGIRNGAKVTQGQVIGYVGSTGLSTGPHLDFRIKKNGQYVNPANIIIPSKAPLSSEQMEDYRLVIHETEQLADGTKKLEDFDAQSWLSGIR